MTANLVFTIIIVFILLEFFFGKYLSYLNAKSWDNPLPDLVKNLYDKEEYNKAKNYAKANARPALLSSLISLVLILAMLFFKGFAFLDSFVKSVTQNNVLQTLLFFGIIMLFSSIINLPFSIYNTFVIEEKYGFNKTTVKTFILDLIKGMLLGAIIGGALLSLLTYTYYKMPANFWWIAWIIMTAFSLLFMTFYTSLIVPIFNKLTPLEEGELRNAIESYANKVDFPLKNIFVIDGSKRSSKANAFFSGLGKTKAIVLYDTLIADNTIEELTAILAHEVGHYKKNHIKKTMVLSILQTGVMFFLFGILAKSEFLAQAFGVSENSFHISLIGFSLLYSPVSMLLGIFMNIVSRKHEFEADAYAKETYNGNALIEGLKKLSKKHLSNLTPNKWYVFVYYSHPPLVERWSALVK